MTRVGQASRATASAAPAPASATATRPRRTKSSSSARVVRRRVGVTACSSVRRAGASWSAAPITREAATYSTSPRRTSRGRASTERDDALETGRAPLERRRDDSSAERDHEVATEALHERPQVRFVQSITEDHRTDREPVDDDRRGRDVKVTVADAKHGEIELARSSVEGRIERVTECRQPRQIGAGRRRAAARPVTVRHHERGNDVPLLVRRRDEIGAEVGRHALQLAPNGANDIGVIVRGAGRRVSEPPLHPRGRHGGAQAGVRCQQRGRGNELAILPTLERQHRVLSVTDVVGDQCTGRRARPDAEHRERRRDRHGGHHGAERGESNAEARAAPPELTEGALALASGTHCERAASEGGSGMVKSRRATWSGSRCRRCVIGRIRSCHATTV